MDNMREWNGRQMRREGKGERVEERNIIATQSRAAEEKDLLGQQS